MGVLSVTGKFKKKQTMEQLIFKITPENFPEIYFKKPTH